jgi:Raf kinase inhibitor-like YbhB/YbcL family protein
MTLTSPVLNEGDTFPANITCADASMMSPELDWTAGPTGTMSYAVTLTDLTNGIVHWAIWNISASAVSLPAGLGTTAMLTTPSGASQVNAFGANGYRGPCPGGTAHTYQFQVYAIPTATLAGTTSMTTNARSSIQKVATAAGTLTGTSNASSP